MMSNGPLKPIPDRTVLLSFDDGNKSDLTNVAPVLVEHGFGATFFITEGLGFLDSADGGDYLTWPDVRSLHEHGFEIGNHTKSHPAMSTLDVEQLRAELAHIQHRCAEHGIPAPSTFCYPGFRHSPSAVAVVAEHGFVFARRGVDPEYHDGGNGGRGPAYDPHRHQPLLVPTTGYAGPEWSFDDLVWAVDQARHGKITSLCFHGVPGRQHPWVSIEPDVFAAHMRYLDDAGCTVISFRALADYVDPAWATVEASARRPA